MFLILKLNYHFIGKVFSKRFYSLKNSRSLLTESYTFQPNSAPLIGSTIGKILEKAALEDGNKIALVVRHQNLRKTFAEINKDADALATGLLSLGLKRGDRVGMWGTNSYEWVLTQFATAKAGLIMTTVNPAYQPPELEYVLKKLQCAALITDEFYKSQNFYEILCKVSPDLQFASTNNLELKNLPFLKHLILTSGTSKPGSIKFQELLNGATETQHEHFLTVSRDVQFDDPVNVQFTSGTTGQPKGATLSHFNIVNNGWVIGKRLGFAKLSPVICLQVPLYHCFGCVVGILACLVHRGTCVIPSPGFDPVASLAAIQSERCNTLYGTPTMYIDMMNLEDFKKYDISSLKCGVMSGAICPLETIRNVKSIMGIEDIFIPYGCTETSPVCTLTGPEDSEIKRITTVGRPLDFIEVKVIDDKNRIVPVNCPGEVCLRGHTTFLGYWGDKEKTQEVLKSDKWYYTGDLGKMDEEGYLYIVGRIKDMIIRGGENIYPREIEELLLQHQEIADVHVVGVPDKRLGEEVCAWVNLKRGMKLNETDLKLYCKGKISHFKIPKYIFFTDSFPKTVTGKVQKFKLKEDSIKRLQL